NSRHVDAADRAGAARCNGPGRDGPSAAPCVASPPVRGGASGVMGSRALDVAAGPERVTIPIDRVPPGPYDCQVAVIDPAGARAVSLTRRGWVRSFGDLNPVFPFRTTTCEQR